MINVMIAVFFISASFSNSELQLIVRYFVLQNHRNLKSRKCETYSCAVAFCLLPQDSSWD